MSSILESYTFYLSILLIIASPLFKQRVSGVPSRCAALHLRVLHGNETGRCTFSKLPETRSVRTEARYVRACMTLYICVESRYELFLVLAGDADAMSTFFMPFRIHPFLTSCATDDTGVDCNSFLSLPQKRLQDPSVARVEK
jgi:hypothetical protein